MNSFDDKNFTKVWLKKKTKKIFKGENKGNDYEIYEGTIDTGSGRMITISKYANTDPVEHKGEMYVVLNARKWKGNSSNRRTSKKAKAW